MERRLIVEIDKIVTIGTFIPWIIIFIISVINNLNNKNYKIFSYDYFKQNVFNIFRLDTLLLIIAFYYFASFDKQFVNKYIFPVMCLYLCVNSFYEKKSKLNKGFLKQNILELVLLFFIMLIPFLIFFIDNNLILTYKIMLLFLFGEYIIILLVSYIVKIIKKIFK